MANPEGFNGMFQPQKIEGDITRSLTLAQEAPISGAPVPGTGTNVQALGQSQTAPAGPMAAPFVNAPKGIAFYKAQAKQWAKLANHPEASDIVKEYASTARQYYNKVKRGAV